MSSKRKCRFCKEFKEKAKGKIIGNFFYCSESCLQKYIAKVIKNNKEKQLKEYYKEKKIKLKTRKDFLKEFQTIFNKKIRERDKLRGCISCGNYSGQMHAGHYYTVGSHPEMRFNELNCHKQCARCNNSLSGNIIKYREGLIERYGNEIIVQLEVLAKVGNREKLTSFEIRKQIDNLKKNGLKQIKLE